MRFWCWATALLFLATPGRAYAHAFAQRYDLPLPLWLYLSGAGATVAVSFVLVALFVRRSPQVLPEPRLELLQTAVGRFVAHPIVLFVIRLASVAIFFTLIAAGLLGIQSDAFDNILPTAVWVIWWVGLAFVAALLGDLWSLVNPWRIVAEWVAQLARGRDRTVEPPVGSSMWPAVGLFAGFAWAELVWPDRAIPANLAVAILLYSGITWLGMYYWGIENWLRRGEAFAALFRLFARFAPLEMRVVTGGSGSRGAVADAGSFRTARRADRRLYLRPYAVGLLTQFVPPASVLFFVLLVLSTVSFDGFAETPAWLNLFQWIVAIPAIGELPNAVGLDNANTLLRTAGLIATPIVFFAVYLLVCSIIALVIPRSHLSEIDGAPARWTAFGLARLFVLTLVPIAIAYHLAHFISLLLIFRPANHSTDLRPVRVRLEPVWHGRLPGRHCNRQRAVRLVLFDRGDCHRPHRRRVSCARDGVAGVRRGARGATQSVPDAGADGWLHDAEPVDPRAADCRG